MFVTVIQELKALMSADSLVDEKVKLDNLINTFEKLKGIEHKEEDVNQLLANDLINELKRKLSHEIENRQKEAEQIKTEKQELITQLDELIENEQNIGKAFADLKNIRKKWSLISEKAPFEQKDIDRKFTKKLEDFYYNINIYKAIQEHDLKRNQQLKEIILEKLHTATKAPTSKDLMAEIKSLREEWEGVGPVSKNLQDEFWSKYRGYLDQLYGNFNNFKASEKEEQNDNLKKKQDIISYIRSVDISNLKSTKDWKNKGKKIIEKQQEWKSTGFVPKESKDQIWHEYKAACDVFFNAQKGFYESQKKIYKANKKLKTDLCKKAESLLESENVNELTQEFIAIQDEWKKIGPVHQKDEQYLWHRFQKSCNDFFKQKKASKKQLDSLKDSLNIQKENIIKELREMQSPSEDEILEILVKWWQTNKEYTRKSKHLLSDFHNVLTTKLLGKSLQDFENENHAKKIEVYRSFDDNGDILLREKRDLQDKIALLTKEVNQYENNLSFFDKGNKTDGLMADVYSKMDNLKTQIETLKFQIKEITAELK